MNFTINRSKWRCGRDSVYALGQGETQLLNKEGYQCCLGQIEKQLGVPDDKIIGVLVPYKTEVLNLLTEDFYLSERAVSINDNRAITNREIALETTAWTKDKKKLKEVFGINIIDQDGRTQINNKSGGEKVWLEAAIQLAIALVVRKQGKHIETAFLDETDDGLDEINANSYLEMINKAHQMSNVYHTLVITHKGYLQELIPQQLRFADGKITQVCS